jgi:hypothetical protein
VSIQTLLSVSGPSPGHPLPALHARDVGLPAHLHLYDQTGTVVGLPAHLQLYDQTGTVVGLPAHLELYDQTGTVVLITAEQMPWPEVRKRTIPSERPPIVDEI